MIIKTNIGIYKYEPVFLYYGRKLIDKQISGKNLIDFKEMLDSENIQFGLIYGTLLGAVREKKFIDYDEDVDVFILDEYRDKFLSTLFRFRNIGFNVARYEGDLLSLIRADDYIDIYIFRKWLFSRKCNGDSLSNYFFKGFDTVSFLDTTFNAPKNHIRFLEYAYGKDWNIPKKNKPAEVKGTVAKIKIWVKNILIQIKRRFKI